MVGIVGLGQYGNLVEYAEIILLITRCDLFASLPSLLINLVNREQRQ